MINPKELRLGNFIFWGLKPAFIQELPLSGPVLNVDGNIITTVYEELAGIPLTQEIIEKNGFEPWSGMSLWHRDFSLERGNKGWNMKQSSGRITKKELSYLHELQNLYFSITGEELQIEGLSV